jgi:peptide/nickel transport system ATP-binding protein
MKLQKRARSKRIDELIEMVQIDPKKASDYPHQLSGGMKQRVMIAMALACNPAILIADEPTTNLDVITQKKIMDLLKALKERLGLSIIYISHDLALILQTCKRVAVLHNGKVIESGLAIDVFNHPNHPYTRRLINSIPRIKKDGKQ